MAQESTSIDADSIGESGIQGEAEAATIAADRRRARADTRASWWLSIGLGSLLILWTLIIVTSGKSGVVVYSPPAQVGEEVASALGGLFAALVLFLFPRQREQERLRWVAAGFVVLSLGTLVFGYLQALFAITAPLDTSMYVALVVRGLAGALFVLGFVPRRPPSFSFRLALPATVLCAVITVGVGLSAGRLPALVQIADLRSAVERGDRILPGLTAWHWALSPIPLVLIVAATAGVVHRYEGRGRGRWLLIALVLLAGSQFQNLFWPSAYSPVLTTANLLRFAFATVVAVGSILELRRIAAERSALFESAEEQTRRLTELAVLRANFTAMVAHEQGSPLGAIRGYTALLRSHTYDSQERTELLDAIDAQVDTLTHLVQDVQHVSMQEVDAFAVKPRIVSLSLILQDAVRYAHTLPGNHALIRPIVTREMVWADPERIGQVLRNLLSNAAKYSSADSPIELRFTRKGPRVRLEVIDQGQGIHPEDQQRIFEKFGRGRGQSGTDVKGLGLGLYLSRGIVQRHGSDLTVKSAIGLGSTFGFDLEVIL